MDQIAAINRYLNAESRNHEQQRGRQKRGVLPFITISRQSGAGGRVLAKALVEAFEQRQGDEHFADWQVFDRSLCEFVASDPEISVRVRELLDESSLNAVQDMVSQMLGASPRRDVYRKVSETIRELALVGKAIIIGRGASCSTRDLSTGIHVRLVAPEPIRIERESKNRGSEVKDVAKWVREQDRNRADLVKRMAGQDISDPLLYDLVCNTERTPVEVVVASIVDWVERQRPA